MFAETSFEELYHTFKNKVFNTVIGYVQNIEDAEEVTQDVFIEIYRSLQKFRGDASLSTWVYRISVNKSLDFIKSKKRKKRLAFVTSLFEPTAKASTNDTPDFVHPGVVMENKERSVILFRAIDGLPENQKTAFILSKLEHLGNKEIAEIMIMSVGAVESLLSRARDNLRKQLAGYYKA